MRIFPVVLVAPALVAGCQHSPPAADKPAPTASVSKPVITPIIGIAGRVVMVNPELRYVVVDFAIGTRLAADRRLTVYRAGEKVGEIIISPQNRENTYAADIVKGEARVGDDVREN